MPNADAHSMWKWPTLKNGSKLPLALSMLGENGSHDIKIMKTKKMFVLLVYQYFLVRWTRTLMLDLSCSVFGFKCVAFVMFWFGFFYLFLCWLSVNKKLWERYNDKRRSEQVETKTVESFKAWMFSRNRLIKKRKWKSCITNICWSLQVWLSIVESYESSLLMQR